MQSSTGWFGILLAVTGGWLSAADWAQFRGPGGNGVSTEVGLPVKWSATSNIAWRTELPGLGTSSPIVVGSRVFVTCYSGYAESVVNPGPMEALVRHIVCLDRQSGKLLWKETVPAKLPESEYQGGNDSWHGYSSSTPASDGTHVYVFFGKTGVFCFTLDGQKVWQTEVGEGTRGWGSANSPVLYQDLVIVNASVESGDMVALDKATGIEKWRTGGIRGSWNTPALVQPASGPTELVVSLPEKVLALDPATGAELWNCEGIPDRGYVCPSVVSHDGIVYAIGGRQNTALAIRAGGRGDVTESHVLWRKNVGSNVSSPVYYNGYLFWIHERQGIANCLDAKTGEIKYQQRLEPRPGIVYASVVAADGKLYCPSQQSGMYVLAASPTFELLAHNVFEEDDHRMNASVAVHDGQILIRNDMYLYCIGQRGGVGKISTR